MDFLNDWRIMAGLFVALLALIGVMLFLRNKKRDED
jgi:hypothetical protein